MWSGSDDQSVANIWPFEFFQDGGPLPFWIWYNSAIRSAVAKNHILEPSIKCIRWPVAEIWPFEIFLMVMKGSWSSIYSVSQKNIPPAVFWNFFPNGWEFLINILHTYYAIISTLEYKFSFQYLQLWQSYAILSANNLANFYISL